MTRQHPDDPMPYYPAATGAPPGSRFGDFEDDPRFCSVWLPNGDGAFTLADARALAVVALGQMARRYTEAGELRAAHICRALCLFVRML